MDDFEGTYAPQSPDLSGFPTFEEPDPFSQNSYYPPQHQQQSYQHQGPYQQQPTNCDPFQFGQPHSQVSQNPYQPSIMPANGGPKGLARQDDDEYAPEPSGAKGGGSRKSKKLKIKEDICDKPAPGVDEGIEVKTKFPVARIKRIMQADDDVGKVAQVTPTAVCEFAPCTGEQNLVTDILDYSESTRAFHDFSRHQSGQRSPSERLQTGYGRSSKASSGERKAIGFLGGDCLQNSRRSNDFKKGERERGR